MVLTLPSLSRIGSPRIRSAILVIRNLGDSSEPEALAGHFDWQRPHCIQASKSSRCFQVKSASVATPSAGSSCSISASKFGMGISAPLGSRSRKKVLIGV